MSIDKLKKEIKSGKFSPVYLLHGEESYLIDEAASFLEQSILQEHEKVFDQQILYGSDVNARYILEQLMQFPMMAPRRLVIVREAQLMDGILELEAFAHKPVPSSILVLCYKGKSLDKRTKLYDGIKKHGFILAADKLKEADILPWVLDTAAEMKMKLDYDAAEAMVELIGNEISVLFPELQKLAGNVTPGVAITKMEILDLVGLSREYNVFELQNALESGNVIKTMRIGAMIAEQKGYSIIPLIALLAGNYTKMYVIRSMINADDNVIAEAMGLKSPYPVRILRQSAKKYTLETLERCIGWLHVYDMKSKGWNWPHKDDRALTIELLGHLMHPDYVPVFAESS
ncbi:MAG TPA: DNA polymerase III subunit delta [Saprospiraceae bacterium]|nr:DNA polymerase III subunit delta [Saprospiraceae bacterium]